MSFSDDFYDELPTKTEKTEQFYLERAIKWRKACDKESENIDNAAMATRLYNKRQTYARSTMRLYRSILRYYFEQYPDESNVMAFAILDDIVISDSQKKTGKTSNKRGKQFSEDTFAALIYALHSPKIKGKWVRLTSLWLQMGALTGLRPHEWREADLIEEGDKLFLKVRNGKNTNNRSHGDFRHLDLSDISTVEKRNLTQFMLLISPYCRTEESFNQLQSGCMHTLKRVNKQLEDGKIFTVEDGFSAHKGSGIYRNVNKRIQLYTGRHRFSSLMKKVAELAEVAAMMGHKTDRTASLHYGKTDKKTIKTRRPKPVLDEVEKIEQKNNLIKAKQMEATPTTPAPTTISLFKPK